MPPGGLSGMPCSARGVGHDSGQRAACVALAGRCSRLMYECSTTKGLAPACGSLGSHFTLDLNIMHTPGTALGPVPLPARLVNRQGSEDSAIKARRSRQQALAGLLELRIADLERQIVPMDRS